MNVRRVPAHHGHGTRLLLKRAFPSITGTGERMWFVATHIKSGMICGRLDNEPVLQHRPPLRYGTTVCARLSEILDVDKVTSSRSRWPRGSRR